MQECHHNIGKTTENNRDYTMYKTTTKRALELLCFTLNTRSLWESNKNWSWENQSCFVAKSHKTLTICHGKTTTRQYKLHPTHSHSDTQPNTYLAQCQGTNNKHAGTSKSKTWKCSLKNNNRNPNTSTRTHRVEQEASFSPPNQQQAKPTSIQVKEVLKCEQNTLICTQLPGKESWLQLKLPMQLVRD